MPEISGLPDEGREKNTLLHEDGAFSLGFTQLPNIVLYARNLSAQAKTLYAILLSYSWKEDKCFPGYARLCEHMGLSEKIVRRHMQELEAVKLLAHKRRGLGKTNIYTLLSLRNAALELSATDERDMSTDTERDTSPVQERDTSPAKEYEVEKDTDKKYEESSKRQSRLAANKGKTVYSHIAHTTTRKDEKRKPAPGGRPQRLSEILEKEPIFIGKPLTQEEVDRKRKEGKNVSGQTPISENPQEHRQETEPGIDKKTTVGQDMASEEQWNENAR